MSPYWNSLRPIAVTEREQARRREPRGGHDAGEPSIDQDRDAATKRYEFLLIGGRDKDRRAGAGEFAQYGMDIEFCRDVDAASGFVEQQNARRARDRAREHDLLLVAAAEAPHPLARSRRAQAHAPPDLDGLGALGRPI